MNERNKVRIAAVIKGERYKKFQQVKALQGFDSDTETAQYIISRGLESCSPAIVNAQMAAQVQKQTAEMFAFVQQQELQELKEETQ